LLVLAAAAVVLMVARWGRLPHVCWVWDGCGGRACSARLLCLRGTAAVGAVAAGGGRLCITAARRGRRPPRSSWFQGGERSGSRTCAERGTGAGAALACRGSRRCCWSWRRPPRSSCWQGWGGCRTCVWCGTGAAAARALRGCRACVARQPSVLLLLAAAAAVSWRKGVGGGRRGRQGYKVRAAAARELGAGRMRLP